MPLNRLSLCQDGNQTQTTALPRALSCLLIDCQDGNQIQTTFVHNMTYRLRKNKQTKKQNKKGIMAMAIAMTDGDDKNTAMLMHVCRLSLLAIVPTKQHIRLNVYSDMP